MKFKYFKITEKETLDHIEECLVSISTRRKSLHELAKQFGALECLVFSGGSIAAFKFKHSERPDKAIWKKVSHGFMPKVKTDEKKLLEAVPKSMNYRDIIKKYGFGNEMIIGERLPNGTGFPMHSSYIEGNRKTGFYVIKVPYVGGFDSEIHDSLVEIKEWEAIKGMDSTEAAL